MGTSQRVSPRAVPPRSPAPPTATSPPCECLRDLSRPEFCKAAEQPEPRAATCSSPLPAPRLPEEEELALAITRGEGRCLATGTSPRQWSRRLPAAAAGCKEAARGEEAAVPGKGGAPGGGPPGSAAATLLTRRGGDGATTFRLCPGRRRAESIPQPGGHAGCPQPRSAGGAPPLKGERAGHPPLPSFPGHAAPRRSPRPAAVPGAGLMGRLRPAPRCGLRAARKPSSPLISAGHGAPRPWKPGCRCSPRARSPPGGARGHLRGCGARAEAGAEQRGRPGGCGGPPVAAPERLGPRRRGRRGGSR